MPDVVLRWAAATDADVDTDYRVESDEAASGTYVTVTTANSTDRGDGAYTPYSTTLNGAIAATDTTIILASGTNFSDGDYVSLNGVETVLLAGKSTNTFVGVTRGVAGTLPVAHASGVAVLKMHETYTDTSVAFSSRNVTRYRIVRVQSAVDAVAAKAIAVYPSTPLDTRFCVVYGIEQDLSGLPKQGVVVTATIADGDNYESSLGETIYQETLTDTTDADGYWELRLVKSKYRQGGDALTITIDTGGSIEVWTVTTIPDLNNVHYLDT